MKKKWNHLGLFFIIYIVCGYYYLKKKTIDSSNLFN